MGVVTTGKGEMTGQMVAMVGRGGERRQRGPPRSGDWLAVAVVSKGHGELNNRGHQLPTPSKAKKSLELNFWAVSGARGGEGEVIG